MNKYLLEITVFVCGAIVMIFELVGSRVLAPYLGSSTVIWTTLIGVVMGSLSLGYYWGGHLADKKATIKILSWIIFGAGVCVLSTFFMMDILLTSLFRATEDKIIILFLSATLLFAPTSVLLGMISPYAAKLKLCDLKSSGTTIGNLYALSTMGSIVGTFMAGFYLIPRFGTTTILLLIAFCLLALSLFLSFGKFGQIKIAGLFVVGTLFSFGNITEMIYADNSLIDIDTEYARVWTFDTKEIDTGMAVRNLKIDAKNSSAMYLESNDLVYEYTKFYDMIAHFKPDFEKSLLLGGAAYSYPKHYLEKYPEKKLDVVEIDPRLTEIAKERFKLKEDPNLRIFHEDARIFLNKNEEKYDAIFGDAFGSQYSIPFHLTTKEAVQRNFDALVDDGVVLCNIVSSIEGKNGKFLRAEYLTYKSIFPQVYLFPVQRENEGETLQNIILVALKSEKKPEFINEDTKLQEYLGHLWKEEVTADVPILTDNYAPVEYYAKMARY